MLGLKNLALQKKKIETRVEPNIFDFDFHDARVLRSNIGSVYLHLAYQYYRNMYSKNVFRGHILLIKSNYYFYRNIRNC